MIVGESAPSPYKLIFGGWWSRVYSPSVSPWYIVNVWPGLIRDTCQAVTWKSLTSPKSGILSGRLIKQLQECCLTCPRCLVRETHQVVTQTSFLTSPKAWFLIRDTCKAGTWKGCPPSSESGVSLGYSLISYQTLCPDFPWLLFGQVLLGRLMKELPGQVFWLPLYTHAAEIGGH